MRRTNGLLVPKRLGQEALQVAGKLGIVDRSLKIISNGDYVVLPLTRVPSDEEADTLKTRLHDIHLLTEDFQANERIPKSLADVLKGKLPPHLMAFLPKSLDIVGRIAIVEIPPELEAYKAVLGKEIMNTNKRIRTVLAKAGAVTGELRLRRMEVIAGSELTETIHKEYGCIYHLDPSKVYFSPRLSQEHRRIAQQVKDRELIVDMFAGVGPFAIQIAKTHKTVTVYAIDLNPDAINFLNKNVSVNNVEGKVIPVLGDARTVIEERLTDVANRVIMNLPERAVEFIDSACKSLKADGGIIHYYSFESEPNVLEKATEKLTEAVIDSNRRVERILSSRLVRPVAPHEWQIGIDAILR